MSSPFPTPPFQAPPPSISPFSAQGRLGRLSFIAWRTTAMMIALILMISAASFIPNFDPDNINFQSFSVVIGLIILLIIICAYLYIDFIFNIKRLHDFNQSGWFSLLSLIPGISTVFALCLILVPGSAIENKYGQPRMTQSWEIFLAWIIIIIFCVLLAVLIPSMIQMGLYF